MAGEIIGDTRIHEGHRARMKAKLRAYGQSIFDTYELLEMLLYSVVPMKDTNPVAKQLLRAFGSLDGVFSADREALMAVPGVGERVADLLIGVGALEQALSIDEENDELTFSDFDKAGAAFVELFRDRTEPCVGVMLLDNGMRLISIEILLECDYDSADVRPRKVLDLALRKHATVVITGHCHPHGPLFPTPGDKATNNLLCEALKAVGITMLDHFVVTGERYIGTMSNIGSKLSACAGIADFIDSRERAEERRAIESEVQSRD